MGEVKEGREVTTLVGVKVKEAREVITQEAAATKVGKEVTTLVTMAVVVREDKEGGYNPGGDGHYGGDGGSGYNPGRPVDDEGNPGEKTNWKVVGPIVGVVAVVVVAVLVVGGVCVAKRRYRGVPQSDL